MDEISFIRPPEPGELRAFSRATKARGVVFVSGVSAGVIGTAAEEAAAALRI